MNDNAEKDEYRNDNIVANIGYKINENFKIQNSFRIADTFFEYDAVNKSYSDNNDSTDNLEASYSLKLIHEKIDTIKDNHLNHMSQDIDKLSKFIWIIGSTVFVQMCYLIVRTLM